MNTVRLSPSRTLKKRSLKGASYNVTILDDGLSVSVNVFMKGKGDVFVSMPLGSTVQRRVGRTTTWFYLTSGVVLKDVEAALGVESVHA